MTIRPSLQLWQHETLTCFITPTGEPAPYWVVIYDEHEPVSQHTFADHATALAHALEALGRAVNPSGTAALPEPSDNDPRR